jgi:hypothetical protein
MTMNLSQMLEAQFVKSPIKTTVSAFKVKNVGIKGVTLELVVLETLGKPCQSACAQQSIRQ